MIIAIVSLAFVACSTQQTSSVSHATKANNVAEKTSVKSYGPGGKIIPGNDVATVKDAEVANEFVITSEQEEAKVAEVTTEVKANKVSEKTAPRSAAKRTSPSFVNTAKARTVSTVRKQFKAEKADIVTYEEDATTTDDRTLLYILLILLVPFGTVISMYLYENNNWTSRVTTNLILTLLCGLPGLIHALVVILGKK